jgi:hypothetical protein
MRPASLLVVALATLLGCGSSGASAPDGRGEDAGERLDAAVRDAGDRPDANVDASPHLDARKGDTGEPARADSGVDARPIDAQPRADAAVAACGCNGMAGCALWKNVYMTWYGYNDNSCGTEAMHGCNDIADPGLGPKMHQVATAGAGTYDDPSTAAASDTMDQGHVYETADGVTLKPGTLIYNPEVMQYFLFEDSCLECGDEYACKLSPDDTDDPSPPAGCQVGKNLHIDFWMGPNDASQPSSLGTCEDNATIGNPYAGTGVIVVNPPPNLPVHLGALYPGNSSTSGGCFTTQQVNGDTCM